MTNLREQRAERAALAPGADRADFERRGVWSGLRECGEGRGGQCQKGDRAAGEEQQVAAAAKLGKRRRARDRLLREGHSFPGYTIVAS